MTLTDTLPIVTLDPALAERLAAVGQKVKATVKQHNAERGEVIAERDQVIVEAYLGGAGVREIARAVDLSHPVVLDIIERSRT